MPICHASLSRAIIVDMPVTKVRGTAKFLQKKVRKNSRRRQMRCVDPSFRRQIRAGTARVQTAKQLCTFNDSLHSTNIKF